MSERIDGLSGVEFTGPRSIQNYSRAGRNIARDLSKEFDFAADEIEAVLIASMKGHPVLQLLGAPDVRMRARRVARRLRRAAELSQGAAVELVKFHMQFKTEFSDVLAPGRTPKSKFDFKED
jgi:hypothetical protein